MPLRTNFPQQSCIFPSIISTVNTFVIFSDEQFIARILFQRSQKRSFRFFGILSLFVTLIFRKQFNKKMGVCINSRRDHLLASQERQPPSWLKQFQIQDPDLVCSSSEPIKNMCISKTCRALALYCDNSNCAACTKYHGHCGHIKLDAITALLRKRAQLQKDLASKIEQIELKFFKSMQRKWNEVLEGFFLSSFNEKFEGIIKSIYFGENKMTFTGDVVEQFYWQLRDSNSRMEKTQADIVKNYRRQMERIAVPFLTQRRKMLSEYLEKTTTLTPEKEKQNFVTQSSIKISDQPFMRSTIVSSLQTQKIQFIQEALDYPKKLKLLFTASENSFKASRFHAACDNVPHTFTLVETEFGKVLGGYTPLTWNSKKGFNRDEEKLGFLLSIDKKEKYTLIKPQKAIQCNPSYGPVFGSGADLALTDQCNLNRGSCLNFPFSYNFKNPYKFSQQTWSALCGVEAGKNFKVREYQVFEVIWTE